MFFPRKPIRLIVFLGLILSLFIPPRSGLARGNDQLNLQAIDAFLQAQVKANRIPGLAVAIVQGDQVAFTKGYGESAPGKSVTPQTQFYIGSITKSFTALAVMQLVEQGKMELDAPIQNYLPWFQVSDVEASEKITVRHLLNHTSGLGESGDPNASALPSSLEEQARLLAEAHLTAPVGTQYQYYNQNYRLLGLLVEQVSGQSYGDYLRSHVFEPLGMEHTTAEPEEATQLAQGYSRAFGFALPQSQRFIPGALPSGYLISSAEDMAQYLLAQLNNRECDGKQMLSPQSLTAMRTPPAGIDSQYGMGWLVMENGNTLAFGGALEYFQAFVVLGLKEKIGLVMLYNQNSMENMLFENNTIRDGLLDLLNGKSPSRTSYGWIGWLLLTLATMDLFNHLRLFSMSHRWSQKASSQKHLWVWTKVVVGILVPLAVIFGLPPFIHAITGGASNWIEPFKLMPDLIGWLLLGMSLNLIRSLLHAMALLHSMRAKEPVC